MYSSVLTEKLPEAESDDDEEGGTNPGRSLEMLSLFMGSIFEWFVFPSISFFSLCVCVCVCVCAYEFKL